jgi:hypothetical protein
MALVVQAALSFSRTQVILTDTTGDYDASTNPTGYGAPNALFTDFAHYAIIRKKNVNSVADEVLVLELFDEGTAKEFKATRTKDGWFEGNKLTITKWTAGTYASGTVRWHNQVVYKANTSTSETPGAGIQWDVVSDLTTIEGNATLTETIDGRVTVYNADTYWSKQIAANSQKGLCGVCEDDRKKSRLDNILFHIHCALVADKSGDNTNGEWNVLGLIQLGAV